MHVDGFTLTDTVEIMNGQTINGGLNISDTGATFQAGGLQVKDTGMSMMSR